MNKANPRQCSSMLERSADGKWGGQEEYKAYKENTPVLIPKL